MQALKEKIKAHYHELLRQRIASLQQQLDAIQESLGLETKSTAGDKYETARAMLHMEQERMKGQMAALLAQQAELHYTDPSGSAAGRGCLVVTDQCLFFISTGLGRAVIDGHTVFALSPQSPLGRQLAGRRPGDHIVLKDRVCLIKALA